MKIRNSFLIFLLIIILLGNITYAKCKTYYNAQVNSQNIAVPIIELWAEDQIIDEVKYNSSRDFSFSIRNYSETEISQVDMLYTIEIVNSNEDFPIEFKLYDEDLNQIELFNNISEILEIDKEIQTNNIYTLVAICNDENIQDNSITDINIKVNAWQKGV